MPTLILRTHVAVFCIAAALLSFVGTKSYAAGQIDIYLPAQRPALEVMAATELNEQLKQLFADVEVRALTNDPDMNSKTPVVLVGNPDTNPAVKKLMGASWPKLSEQGIVLKSASVNGKPVLVVGGGSPAAIFWAAAELGHQLGIRSLLHGDIYPRDKYPAESIAAKLGNIDVVMEPTLKVRTWRTVNDFAIGPESWGLADQKKLFKQLAKLKFNRIMLSVYPWHPFVHYEFGGVKKQTGVLWFGETFRIDGDTPGRSAFGNAKVFENPDFAGATTYEQMTAAGKKHMQGLIDAAHELGMSVGISMSPLEFPREFAAALPGSRSATGLKGLTMTAGAAQKPDDEKLRGLVKAQIRAFVDTYRGIDVLYLSLPEFPEWQEHAESAWQRLTAGQKSGVPALNELIKSAESRKLVSSGKRGVQSVRGNIVTLSFLRDVLADKNLLVGKNGRFPQVVITDVDPALFEVLPTVLPENAGAQHFVDYTARRVVENRELLTHVPAAQVPSSLILTLADDNVGILPQSAVRRIETLVGDLEKLGWEGFSTRYWMLAELDPTVFYLSRASFDSKVTAHSAHDDLFATITGNQSASDRLWLGFGHIESATEIIDKNDIGFTFPVEGMLTRHLSAEPVPAWWDELTKAYIESSNELYRSHDAVDLRARPTVYYYAKRSEYVLDYLNAVKETRLAGIARAAGKNDEAATHLETAVESMYNAIDTLGDIARDPSDRGLIAVLAEHAYRPLVAELERAQNEMK